MHIADFLSNYQEQFSFNPNSNRSRKVGVTIDYPVVRTDNYKSGSAEHALESLAVRDWNLHLDKFSREVVGVEKNRARVACGMGSGILEVSVPPQFSIWAVAGEHKPLVSELYDAARERGAMLLGYGAQPIERKTDWTNRGMYLALRESLAENFTFFDKEKASFTAAGKLTLAATSRAYVEVGRKEFGDALTVLNAISPFITALFGHSPLCLGTDTLGDTLVSRTSCFGQVPEKRTQFPRESVEDMEDYLQYMAGLELLVAEGSGSYYSPRMAFENFLRGRNEEETMRNFFLQEQMMWWGAVPNGETGTIMVQTCTQPHEDQLSFAAFILGIVENLENVRDWLEPPEGWLFLAMLDKYAAKYGLSDKWRELDNYPFHELMKNLLALSEDGLEKRDMSEAMLLVPLWERLHARKNPAEKAFDLFAGPGWSELVHTLSRI